jgi:microcin C transport system substrate-binding protein
MPTRIRNAMLTAGFGALLICLSSISGFAQEWRTSSSLIDPEMETKPFERFAYVNPDAPKGGTLNSSAFGTFDSFNPFIVQGNPAAGVGSFGGILWETLMQQSLDEAGTSHGLVAEAFKYPDDYSSAVYRINPDARWHDGEPITADDVVWSFETLKRISPLHMRYYANVTEAVALNEREVEFTFDQTGNRELPHIMGDLPVLPRHWWEGENARGQQRNIENPTLEPPLGSGPYRIAEFSPGSHIIWERVEDYWGAELPVNIGRNNFDRRRFTYFQDDNAIWEAFKKGGIQDFRVENRAGRWATGYDFPAYEDGAVVKHEFTREAGQPMQAFVLNTRHERFDDRRVRKALTYAFDFESLNRTQFYDFYSRTTSYFEGSELGATGLPEGLELEILQSLEAEVPEEVFTEEFTLPVHDSPQATRQHLRHAVELFAEAGWTSQGGRLVNEAGEQFRIEFLAFNPDAERVTGSYINTLRRLGIDASLRIIDSSQYVNRQRAFEFDVTTAVFQQSLSPGNEQRDYWSTEAADMPGSRNLAGIRNDAVDELIDRIIFAADREELVAASRALDRVLLWNYYMVPQWHNPNIWTAFWDKFGIPDEQPTYVGVDLDSWWVIQEREEEIEEAYEEDE